MPEDVLDALQFDLTQDNSDSNAEVNQRRQSPPKAGDPRLYVCQAPGALIRVSTCGSILGPFLKGLGFQSVFRQESVFYTRISV